MDLTQVLIKPVVTEKSSSQEADGRYTFVVNSKATKIEIKNAVKVLYGAEVKHVTVRPTPAKTRQVGRGRTITKRQNVKKATFQIKDNARLDLYKFTKVKEKPKKEAPQKKATEK